MIVRLFSQAVQIPFIEGTYAYIHRMLRNKSNMSETIRPPVFAFVYIITDITSGRRDTISYNSITNKLRKNDTTKELSDEDKDRLIKTFRDNGFFEAEIFYYPPGTGIPEYSEYLLIATSTPKGACITWFSISKDVPKGLLEISSTIEQTASGPVIQK
jgi:hypothetical protein